MGHLGDLYAAGAGLLEEGIWRLLLPLPPQQLMPLLQLLCLIRLHQHWLLLRLPWRVHLLSKFQFLLLR